MSLSPPKQDRRVWFAVRLGVGPDRVEIHHLAVKLGLILGPQRLHRQDTLAHQLEARCVDRAVIFHLLGIPAAADAEHKSPARQLVQARHAFGGDDRIALRHQADAGAELERFGRRGGEGQRDERVVGVAIAFRKLAAARKGRAAAGGDVGVLADEQGFKTAILQRLGQLAGVDAVVGRKIENTYTHDFSSRLPLWEIKIAPYMETFIPADVM